MDADRELAMLVIHWVKIFGEAPARAQRVLVGSPRILLAGSCGFAQRLIHRFDDINCVILWALISDELPALIGQLEAIPEQEA